MAMRELAGGVYSPAWAFHVAQARRRSARLRRAASHATAHAPRDEGSADPDALHAPVAARSRRHDDHSVCGPVVGRRCDAIDVDIHICRPCCRDGSDESRKSEARE